MIFNLNLLVDVISAAGFEDIKKQKLYQTELRNNDYLHKSLHIPEVANLLDYN